MPVRRIALVAKIVAVAASAAALTASQPARQRTYNDPLEPIAPTDRAQCRALNSEWQTRIQDLVDAEKRCSDAVWNACMAKDDVIGAAACVTQQVNPGFYRDPMNNAHYSACQGEAAALRQARLDAAAAVTRCNTKVAAAQKAAQSEQNKSASSSSGGGSDDRTGEPPPGCYYYHSDEGRSTGSSPERWTCPGDKTRKDPEKPSAPATPRDPARDKAALDAAQKASEAAQQALGQRSAERDAERAKIDAGQAARDQAYQQETAGIMERAQDLAARISDSLLGTSLTGPSALGGASTGDFAFDAGKEATDKYVDKLTDVAYGFDLLPFAGLPLSVSRWLLTENLTTLNQLSATLDNFERATPEDVDQIWNDYGVRAWSPEAWAKQVTVHVATGLVSHALEHAAEPVMETIVDGVVERTSRAASRGSFREIFRSAPEVSGEPRVYGWWSGSSKTVHGAVERDGSGLAIVRDSDGTRYRYDGRTNRVDYTQAELEDMVAYGNYRLSRRESSVVTWTYNQTVIFPTGHEIPELPFVRVVAEKVVDHVEDYVYSPVEEAMGAAIEQMIDDGSAMANGSVPPWMAQLRDMLRAQK